MGEVIRMMSDLVCFYTLYVFLESNEMRNNVKLKHVDLFNHVNLFHNTSWNEVVYEILVEGLKNIRHISLLVPKVSPFVSTRAMRHIRLLVVVFDQFLFIMLVIFELNFIGIIIIYV